MGLLQKRIRERSEEWPHYEWHGKGDRLIDEDDVMTVIEEMKKEFPLKNVKHIDGIYNAPPNGMHEATVGELNYLLHMIQTWFVKWLS